jgi:uncharacterized protein YhaN
VKLRGWHLEKFGCFSDHKVENLPDGLLVVLGPNEAGKSTLHAFIKGVLFGFPARNAKGERRLIQGAVPIGRLFLEVDGLRYSVERKNVAKSPVVVRGADGSEGDDVLLRRLLNDADASVFRSIFAFGLKQLQDFSSLGEEQVRDKLFSASLGTTFTSPTKAAEGLLNDATNLYKERGSTSAQSHLRVLIQKAHDLRHRLTSAQGQAKEYPILELEETKVLGEMTALRSTERRLIDEQRVCLTLIELLPVHDGCRRIRTELEQLPAVSALPPDAERQLAEATTLCREAAVSLQAVEEENLRLRGEVERIVVSAPLLQAATKLDPVLADLPLQRERLARIQGAQHEMAMMGQTLAAQLERLGAGWTEQRIAAWSRNALNRSEVQEWQAKQERATAAHDSAAHMLKSAQAALTERARDAAECRKLLPQPEPMSREDIGRREAALQRLRALREAERDRQNELRECESRLREAEQRRVPELGLPSRPLLVGTAIAILFGAGCAAANFVVPTFLFLAIAIILIAMTVLKRSHAVSGVDPAVAAARGQRDKAASLLETMRAELATAASAIGVSTIASSEELSVISAYLVHQREQRTELEHRLKQIQSAEALVERERAHVQQAEVDDETARRTKHECFDDWASAASRMGLPAVSPTTASLLIEVADGAKDHVDRLRNQQAALERDKASASTWTERARDVLAAAQAPPGQYDDAHLVEKLGIIASDLAANRDAARRREEAEARLSDAGLRFTSAKRRDEEARTRLAALLQEGGCTTPAELTERLAIMSRRESLGGELASAEQQLDAVLRMLPDPAAGREELSKGAPADWSDRAERIKEELEALTLRRDECARQQNQLAGKKKLLHTDSQIADLDLDRTSTVAQIEQVAHEWLALRFAAKLIRQTKEEYERKRQPGVIANATPLFTKVTRGRYTGILQREEDSGLYLIEADGERRKESDLSQGTQEQLYLSLRLALAQEFAQGKPPLPLIMDDVLVNFDPERAAAVADVLREVAKTRQVLVFTCHPWVRDMLLPDDDGSRVVTLERAAMRSASLAEGGHHAVVA